MYIDFDANEDAFLDLKIKIKKGGQFFELRPATLSVSPGQVMNELGRPEPYYVGPCEMNLHLIGYELPKNYDIGI
jgi:hypothetical protein